MGVDRCQHTQMHVFLADVYVDLVHMHVCLDVCETCVTTCA